MYPSIDGQGFHGQILLPDSDLELKVHIGGDAHLRQLNAQLKHLPA
jgi:hypothetical protein